MTALGRTGCGATVTDYTCKKVKIMATYERVIEISDGEDFDEKVERAFDGITLDDLDYDWEELGTETETVYLRG